jgi:hypothetical protein
MNENNPAPKDVKAYTDASPERVTCMNPTDFYITAGTVKLTGPTVVKAIAAGFFPVGPGLCRLTGNTATCPIPVLEFAGIYSPDTGVPAAAGHYSLVEVLGSAVPPGQHIDIQVTQVG